MMVKIIKDIIEAVNYLHKKRIRHLNVTPENILIFECWHFGVCAKLSNFTFHSMESAYTYVLISVPHLIVVGYNIVKSGNHMAWLRT
jgi:hypothetical protein